MTSGKPLGIVLAGGLARRMGGGDKARIRIGGKSILERVLARIAPQCTAVIINANGDPARFADTGLPVVADGVAGFVGPLAGILAGLDWAAEHMETERSPGLPSLMVTTRRRLIPHGTSFSFLQAVTQALHSMQRSASQRNFIRAIVEPP